MSLIIHRQMLMNTDRQACRGLALRARKAPAGGGRLDGSPGESGWIRVNPGKSSQIQVNRTKSDQIQVGRGTKRSRVPLRWAEVKPGQGGRPLAGDRSYRVTEREGDPGKSEQIQVNRTKSNQIQVGQGAKRARVPLRWAEAGLGQGGRPLAGARSYGVVEREGDPGKSDQIQVNRTKSNQIQVGRGAKRSRVPLRWAEVGPGQGGRPHAGARCCRVTEREGDPGKSEQIQVNRTKSDQIQVGRGAKRSRVPLCWAKARLGTRRAGGHSLALVATGWRSGGAGKSEEIQVNRTKSK